MSQVANSNVDVTLRYRPHIPDELGYCDRIAEGDYQLLPPAVSPAGLHVEATVKNLTALDRNLTIYVDSESFSHLMHSSVRIDAGATGITNFSGIPTALITGTPGIYVRVVHRHTSPTPDETLMEWTFVDTLEQSAECTVAGEKKCVGEDEYTCIGGNWVLTGPGLCAGVCTTGEKKCVGADEYTCFAGEWILTGPGACTGEEDGDESFFTKYWKYLLAGGAVMGGILVAKPWRK